MPPFNQKKADDIVSSTLTKLTTNTNITQLTPGGKARFFLEVFAEEQSSQYAVFNDSLAQAFIQYAKGNFLDFFGDMFGVPRLEAKHAESDINNFMFYVNSGTFGDINNTQDIVIPAGTTLSLATYPVQFVSKNITPTTISYSTTREVTASAGGSFVYVPARANIEGKEGNIARGVLTEHDFINYTSSPSKLLKCTNRFAIDTGDDRESDGAYRYRLLQVFRTRKSSTAAAVRFAALSVPGVSDLTMIPYEQGPGTFTVYLKTTTPTVSPRILDDVRIKIGSIVTEGIRYFVEAPTYIGLEFIVGINWNPKTTNENRAIQQTAVREAMDKKLASLGIGESIDLVDLVQLVVDYAPSALSIGKLVPNKFEEVYVYKASGTGVGVMRTKLYTESIVPLYNEKIILETANSYSGVQFV
jgi:uncharacterized phage protein gp47/JayE